MESEGERPAPAGSESDPGIHAFLIADIRGYSTFTHERGDQDAARLAERFASITGDVVTDHRGRVLELRGDEALAVFTSPRAASRAAVALQLRYVAETIADPSLPLAVGIGLDAGEAVPVGEGYRGEALNVAARLCSLARAGEVLASREMAHLAGRVDGVRIDERGQVDLKGIGHPVVVVTLRSDREDTVESIAPFVRPSPGRHRSTRWLVPAAVAFAILVAVLVPILGGEVRSSMRPNSVGLLDPSTGEVTATVPLDGRPRAIAASGDTVWVAQPDIGTIVRIDPSERGVVDTIPGFEDPTALAVDEESVWVVEGGGPAVSRISSETGEVVQTIEGVGNGPSGVAVGFDSVWVASRFDGTLVRVDPARGEVETTIPIGLEARHVATGFGSVWVSLAGQNEVVRVDPNTDQITPIAVGGGPEAIAIGADAVWVVNTLDDTVSAIDPRTEEVTTTPVGEGPSSITVLDESIWVGNEADGTVTALRPGSEPERFAVRSTPEGLTGTGDGLWVSVGEIATSHRGGTLRVTSYSPPFTLDPAVAYDIFAFRVLPMVGDGLVAFREVGGIEGQTLVPDLATTLHRPTDGGKTYTFRLRDGIRYSTGDPLQASDFRRAFERGFRMRASRENYGLFFGLLVGAAECVASPRGCDLSDGIQAEDAEGIVTFRLTADDPEFLYKLALPFAYPVPASTPTMEQLRTGVPGTGPYALERPMSDEALSLVRNSYFREWSAEAQPDGNADRIEWTFRDASELVDAVNGGEADIAMDPDTTLVDDIALRFAGQVHTSLNQDIVYISMRTDVPPFDHLDVRRALNLAIDRARVVDILGGEATARATCQQIPPNFPGYRAGCVFTSGGGSSGIWAAPDLKEAHRLIQRSGTAGTRVTYWFNPGMYGCCERALARYVVALLESLGYRARAHPIGSVGPLYEPENRYQLAFTYWAADYPSASTFFSPVLTCGAPLNTSALCDQDTDALIDKAIRTQGDDPEAARMMWEQVDRAIVEQAPHLWLVNPLSVDFVSDRLGNYQRSPQWGPVLSQMWVR